MSDSTTTLGAQALDRRRAASLAVGPAGATAAVVVLCLIVLEIFDVPLTQSVPYLGYELGFVVVPGILVTLAITGARRLGLQELVLGIGVGYGIELLFFVATASTGLRSLFPWFPLVVAAASLPFIRARPTISSVRTPGEAAWLLAAIMAALVGFLANSILDTPIPQHIGSLVGYPTDMLWSTSITAEAVHHWPLTIPSFSGLALHYHYFAYLHLAGVSQTTGLSPWLLNFRFFPLWAALLTAFELYAFAKIVSRRRSAGLIAAFALFLASDFLPWTGLSQQILNVVWISVTFAFGMVVFIPLLTALRLLVLDAPDDYRSGSGWILAVGLTAVAAGSKAPIIVIVVAALALAAVWAARFDRAAFRTLATAAGAAIVVFAVAWFVLYRTTNGSITLKPFGMIKPYEPFQLIAKHVPHPLLWLFWLVAAVIVAIKLFAAMLPGIAGAVRWRPRRETVLLLSPVVTGGVAYFAFTNLGNSQNYFLYYAEIAAAVVAGIGLAEGIARYVRPIAIPTGVVAVAVGAVLVVWMVETPFNPVPKPVWQNITNRGGATTPEYLGFRWIATHTSTAAVLAVDARQDPTHCFQTAFAERRALIDCYFGFAPEVSLNSVQDLHAVVSQSRFEEIERRVALNDAIFDKAAPSALATAYREYGVRYVVVDLRAGGTAAEIARLARRTTPVFRNAAVAVFRLSA